MKQIDTIIFDLGSVLIDWNPFPVILKSFNGDQDKTKWFLENVCTHEWNLSLDKGKSFNEARIEKNRQFPQFTHAINAYLDDWPDMLLGTIPAAVEILHKLDESKKYKLYSITNWSHETFPIALNRFPFLTLFKDIIVSGDVKMVKPDLEIYHYAIERFKIESPQSAIFIDDRIENVKAAEKAGFNGIHFINPLQFKEQLQLLGIL